MKSEKLEQYLGKEVTITFNDTLIQLNNIKNTQIDYLKESGE